MQSCYCKSPINLLCYINYTSFSDTKFCGTHLTQAGIIPMGHIMLAKQ